jgi:AcrR family transcriptional regulator
MVKIQSSETASNARGKDEGRASRRRGAELESALLEAAWEELKAVGYESLTMEGVAERAGTSRTVLYRRWPSRLELVLAALRHRGLVRTGTVPNTGSLREDVLALLRLVSDRVSEVGPQNLSALLSGVYADSGATAAVEDHFMNHNADVMEIILKRAADRGEIRGDISTRIATLPVDLVRHELLLARKPSSKLDIIEIVDAVFLPLVLTQKQA